MMDDPPSTSMYLVGLSGPAIEPFKLDCPSASSSHFTLGRHESCELQLPAVANSISRQHARFRFDANARTWRVTDLESSWGTWLNGVKLTPGMEMPLVENDLLRLEPWTFAVRQSLSKTKLQSQDDTGHSSIRAMGKIGSASQPLREDLLALLLEAAGAVQKASTDLELAEQLVDVAVRGSGFPNAAVVRAIDSNGQIEVLAARTPRGRDASDFSFSRSVITAASQGQIVELSQDSGANAPYGQSIVQLNISVAVCVPLMLGPSPAAYLYMDARGLQGSRGAGQATVGFCSALGTLAGLALANLKRVDIERRQAVIEHDLHAAAAAQKWVLPPRVIQVAGVTVIGESRPGRYVGGDFFDVIDLGKDRLAIALGDVSGKGVDASVLMTATQGFLNATLQHNTSADAAAKAVNAFVYPRRPASRFVTLWIGVIDRAAGTLAYVDAGHGYALMIDSEGALQELNEGDGLPIGVLENYPYAAKVLPLPKSGRIIVVSDGIIEQPAAAATGSSAIESFDLRGVHRAIADTSADEVTVIFQELIKHAGTTQLADDATAVSVRW